MKAIITIVCAAMLAACAAASEEMPAFAYFDEQGGRVRDGAGILSPEVQAQLVQDLDRAEQNYGPQLAVVTVDSLEGYSIEDFSLEYARAWGLGDAERNDGLMVLIAPNERKVRIEVGSGIEGSFTDLFCAEIIENAFLPSFKDGEFEAGLTAGVELLIEHMQRYPTIPANDNPATPNEVSEAA